MPRLGIRAVIGLSALCATLAIYLLRMNDVAGLMVDDAWYVLFAKSLADGSGYRIISSAAGPMLPLYPPGFPALLSFAFLVNPAFPGNVWLLKSVSVAAMIGVGTLSYVYLHSHRQLPRELAISAAGAITITPAFVFLATSTVMSECVFTLAQLACVVLLHRAVDGGESQRSRLLSIAAGGVAAATVLIRTAGVGLVAAAVLWLIMERRWRALALFSAAAVPCLAVWLMYASANGPTREQRLAHGGAVSYNYTEQIGMRWAGSPAFGRATASEIPTRIGGNLVDVLGRDTGGLLLPGLFRGPSESGEEIVALGGRAGLVTGSMGNAVETMVISFALSGVVLIGFFVKARERVTVAELLIVAALTITLVWPFWTFRFVLPLTPFLFLYLIAGVRLLSGGSWRAARLALLCIGGLSLVDHAGYVALAKSASGSNGIQWLVDARNVSEAIGFTKTGLADGILASTNPALVFLHTQRKGIALDDPGASMQDLKSRGIRYGASFVPAELPDASLGDYRVLYRSPARLWVIELR